MLRRLLIAGTSLRVSTMALGVMPWGTVASEEKALRLYDVYREAGGNVVDTAHIYASWLPQGDGASERTLGKVLKARGDRRQVVLISKGGHPGESFYKRPQQYLAPEVVAKDIAESLERMGVGMIDLYFLHRDDARVPVGEIIGMMNEQVGTGRIRYFGASNWSTRRMEEANRWAAEHGVMGFVASEPEFSLAQRNGVMGTTEPALRWLLGEDVAWHERTGMAAFCYSPTAKGYFACGGEKGKELYDNEVSRGRLKRVQEVARRRGVTANQVALAWVMGQGFPAVPILGTADEGHLRDGLGAEGVALGREEMGWLLKGGT